MFVLPDFIDAQAVAELLAANARHTGPRRGDGTPWADCRLSDITPDSDLTERVRLALANHYPRLPPLASDYVAYTLLKVGASHPLHADAVKLDGSPNHTPQRVVTAMLYLGSEGKDFTGGSIRFPALGTTIRPVAGTLVGFRCDLSHRHEVPRVTRGERHAVAFWFKEAP